MLKHLETMLDIVLPYKPIMRDRGEDPC